MSFLFFNTKEKILNLKKVLSTEENLLPFTVKNSEILDQSEHRFL